MRVLSFLLIAFFIMTGCGKKVGTQKQHPLALQQTTQVIDTNEYLDGQQVICEEGTVCPNFLDYLVKIVVFDNKKPRTCTGFIVNSRTVATSASCLPQLMRLKDQDCSQDVTFFFPQTITRPAERVSCSKVLQFSDIQSRDAALWRDDVAFLEMDNDVSRHSRVFSREGFDNQRSYTLWAVDQIDDKTGIIRRQRCESLHDSYINPLASKNTSPVMLFAGCSLKDGNSGAPILDFRGRVRGMVSRSIDLKLRTYLDSTRLLTEPLREMFYGTNFSCAPTIFDSSVEDQSECSKVMDQSILDGLRREMLAREDFYEEKRKELELKVSGENRFLNFSVRLIFDDDVRRAEITPKCFKNVSSWVNRINASRGNFSFTANLPQLSFKPTIGPDGKIGAMEVDDGIASYFLQFSVRQLKSSRVSDVHVWNSEKHLIYNSLSENCN
jgi:hypothetical protein